MVGVLRKKILSSTFQYEEMIENKEKIRAGPIDLGGPIKPHSSVMCHNKEKEKRRPFLIESILSAVRQSGFNVNLAFASAGRASAHLSTGSLKWMSDFSIPCLRVAYHVNSRVYFLSDTSVSFQRKPGLFFAFF